MSNFCDDWYGNTVVYTACNNNYDYTHPQLFQDGVDYIYFTDGSIAPRDSRWRIESLPPFKHINYRRIAKIPKIYPHFFSCMRDYKYAIWIDADMQILDATFPQQFISHMQHSMLFSRHFDGRMCCYSEARPNKYPNEPVEFQLEYYRNEEGFPEDFGLFEAGFHAKKMLDPIVEELGKTWLLQTLLFSPQDQLSLPFSLWKTQLEYSTLPISYRDMGWVQISAHKSGKAEQADKLPR